MMERKQWKVVGADGKSVYEIVKEAIKTAWDLYQGDRGFRTVVYISDIDFESRVITVDYDIITPSTDYRWAGDYHAPSTILRVYDPEATWDHEDVGPADEPGKLWVAGELVDEEEYVEEMSSEMADEEGIIEAAIETADEILYYETGEVPESWLGEWFQEYDGSGYEPGGEKVIKEKEITGKWGPVWVSLYDEGDHYCVHVGYSDAYLPPAKSTT